MSHGEPPEFYTASRVEEAATGGSGGGTAASAFRATLILAGGVVPLLFEMSRHRCIVAHLVNSDLQWTLLSAKSNPFVLKHDVVVKTVSAHAVDSPVDFFHFEVSSIVLDDDPYTLLPAPISLPLTTSLTDAATCLIGSLNEEWQPKQRTPALTVEVTERACISKVFVEALRQPQLLCGLPELDFWDQDYLLTKSRRGGQRLLRTREDSGDDEHTYHRIPRPPRRRRGNWRANHHNGSSAHRLILRLDGSNDVSPPMLSRCILVFFLFCRWILVEIRSVMEAFVYPTPFGEEEGEGVTEDEPEATLHVSSLFSLVSFFRKLRWLPLVTTPPSNAEQSPRREERQSEPPFSSAMQRSLIFILHHIGSVATICLIYCLDIDPIAFPLKVGPLTWHQLVTLQHLFWVAYAISLIFFIRQPDNRNHARPISQVRFMDPLSLFFPFPEVSHFGRHRRRGRRELLATSPSSPTTRGPSPWQRCLCSSSILLVTYVAGFTLVSVPKGPLAALLYVVLPTTSSVLLETFLRITLRLEGGFRRMSFSRRHSSSEREQNSGSSLATFDLPITLRILSPVIRGDEQPTTSLYRWIELSLHPNSRWTEVEDSLISQLSLLKGRGIGLAEAELEVKESGANLFRVISKVPSFSEDGKKVEEEASNKEEDSGALVRASHSLCYVCVTAQPDALTLPCLHGGLCVTCMQLTLTCALRARSVPKCPLCRCSIRALGRLTRAAERQCFAVKIIAELEPSVVRAWPLWRST